MEPITTLIVTAAALGAAAGLKPTAEQAVKDTYAAFKRIITDHYGDYRDLIGSLEFLSKKPEDSSRQATFKNELTNAGATDDSELIQAAKAIHIAVETHSPETPTAIGMDIEELKAAVLEAENVKAGESSTAVRIKKAEIEGSASFKNIGGKPSASDPN
jgi:hypothetical protein